MYLGIMFLATGIYTILIIISQLYAVRGTGNHYMTK